MDRKTIAEGLRSLGLKKGSIVLLHSSFLSLGQVKKGPPEVIKAFLDVIGEKGTLMVPAFGQLGVLVEEVKNLPGVVISSCPLGTVAACGPDAEELCADHWKADTAHGKDTPYTRLADKGGVICLLGVDQDRNTSLHSVEALLKLPYLSTISRTFQTPEDKEVTRDYHFFPGPHRDFIGLDRLLSEAGVMKTGRIGSAQVRLIDSAGLFETLLAVGAQHPDFVLCDNPECSDCVKQRAALHADVYAKESFQLAASTRLAGRYVPEIIENLQREGISAVELDFLQGKPCWMLPADKLAAAIQEFADEKIAVSALRLPVIPDDALRIVSLLKTVGIKRVVMPMQGASALIKALDAAGTEISLANCVQTARSAASDLMSARMEVPGVSFTFNPADFTRAGEHPFLHSYRAGRFIKTIRQLDIADCTWEGDETLFARGNSEVKELISILRCGNFSGWFVLGGGAPYPGTLAEAAENFRNLLASM